MPAPAAIQKAAFVERVARRAERCGVHFDVIKLDEWIKQGLAFKADRAPSESRRPIYTYGHRHYRRALQLVRLYGSGIKDRDAILLQLFLREYSVRPHEVRDSLLKEFRKARRKLNAAANSIYADRIGPIPAGRRRQIKRQLGQPDHRLVKTGMVPSDDFIIEVVRAARTPKVAQLQESFGEACFQDGLDLEHLSHSIVKAVCSGMLVEDDEQKTEIERLIVSSTAAEYEQARMVFISVRSMFGVASLSREGFIAEGVEAIWLSLLSREFAAFFFVMALRITAIKPS
jgi:hypothetical protein